MDVQVSVSLPYTQIRRKLSRIRAEKDQLSKDLTTGLNGEYQETAPF